MLATMTECRYIKYSDNLSSLVKILMGNSCYGCHTPLPKCINFIENMKVSVLLIPIWFNKHGAKKGCMPAIYKHFFMVSP